MTQIILDSGLSTKLLGYSGPLELCDQAGRVLGTFYPRTAAIDYDAIERARPKLTKEEMERRRQGPTYTTDEVVKLLESL